VSQDVSTVSSLTHEDLGSDAQRARHTRILDATIALASLGGFDAVQMRAVAERADVALGTLYRYFPSKIHLLVSALAREFEQAALTIGHKPIPGDDQADRVMFVLGRATATLQRDPHLTEALTRAFMFADASVADESKAVGRHVTRLLAQALQEPGRPGEPAPTDEQLAITKVIADVWLASLVQWVTGRATADEVTRSLDVAVRLLLR
jgi:TetR/AcrR family transcriptional regulator, cholesterol catabolism regulator